MRRRRRRWPASTFTEHGAVQAVDPLRFGDIVLARKDLPAAYHLAVVVDDAFQNISLVTRGEDLLSATHACSGCCRRCWICPSPPMRTTL